MLKNQERKAQGFIDLSKFAENYILLQRCIESDEEDGGSLRKEQEGTVTMQKLKQNNLKLIIVTITVIQY